MSQTVEQLLEERIDGEIESVIWHRSSDRTHYGIVGSINRDGPATVSLTTVILDLEDDTLRIHSNNSMWVPGDQGALDGTIRSLARCSNILGGSLEERGDRLEESSIEFEPEEIHAYEMDDDYDPSESGDWKESGGVEERYQVHERLEESGIKNPDRMIRLEFGSKAPWEGEPQRFMRPPEEVGGTYGIEVSEDDDLVILDIDDMEEAPLEEMPETLRSRSPHGGEHRFYHVPGWLEEFRERFSAVNPHPSFGEVRSQDGYVVGPGCELTTCKHEDCCSEESPGEYEMLDAPITTISAEEFADLIAPYREESR